MAALIWLILALVLIIAEFVSGEFVLLMLGLGALFGAGSAYLTDGATGVDVAAFAVSSVALLFVIRPLLKRKFFAGSGLRTNTDALIGTEAVVLSAVDTDGGQVKLGGGVWSARSLAPGRAIEPGTRVTVVEIAGATAVVSTIE